MVTDNAELCGGLYFLKESTSTQQTVPSTTFISQSNFNFVSISKEDEIMIWHFHLGHPHFVYLEKILPHLFTNKNLNSYHVKFVNSPT